MSRQRRSLRAGGSDDEELWWDGDDPVRSHTSKHRDSTTSHIPIATTRQDPSLNGATDEQSLGRSKQAEEESQTDQTHDGESSSLEYHETNGGSNSNNDDLWWDDTSRPSRREEAAMREERDDDDDDDADTTEPKQVEVEATPNDANDTAANGDDQVIQAAHAQPPTPAGVVRAAQQKGALLPRWSWAYNAIAAFFLSVAVALLLQAGLSADWVTGHETVPTRRSVDVGLLRSCSEPEGQGEICRNVSVQDISIVSWQAAVVFVGLGLWVLCMTTFSVTLAVVRDEPLLLCCGHHLVDDFEWEINRVDVNDQQDLVMFLLA